MSDPHDVGGGLTKAKAAIASSNEPTTDTLAIGAKMPDGTDLCRDFPGDEQTDVRHADRCAPF